MRSSSPAARAPRVYAFIEIYPNPHRPYLDVQFAALIDAGYDVHVFASRAWPQVHQLGRDYGLEARTTYYPATAGEALGALGRGLAHAPLATLRALGAAWRARAAPFAWLAEAGRRLAVPHAPPALCLVHDFWVMLRFPFLRERFGDAPILLYHHGSEASTMKRYADPGVAFRMADIVGTNTEASRAEAMARGCPADRLTIVPVGLRVEAYQDAGTNAPRASGVTRFLSAGRLVPEKGIADALHAFARVAADAAGRVEYRIVGSGPHEGALRALVATLGIAPLVSFAGHLPNEQLVEEYRAADVLLLPSRSTPTWRETQALVVQEAMLMRCLPIVTRVGGVPECIPPELAGYAVPEGDPAALEASMRRALALTADERRDVGALVRDFALARYDVRVTNERLLAAVGILAPQPEPVA